MKKNLQLELDIPYKTKMGPDYPAYCYSHKVRWWYVVGRDKSDCIVFCYNGVGNRWGGGWDRAETHDGLLYAGPPR